MSASFQKEFYYVQQKANILVTYEYHISKNHPSKQEVNAHSTDEAVSVPLLIQRRDELFTDRTTTAAASRSKQSIIVVPVTSHPQHVEYKLSVLIFCRLQKLAPKISATNFKT